METATKALRRHTVQSGEFAITVGRGHGQSDPAEFPRYVSRAELQAIVQAAYDQHGILAEPSYTTEAERDPEPWVACPDCEGEFRQSEILPVAQS